MIKETLACACGEYSHYYRTKPLGKVPEDRDSYDPAPILSTEDGGDKVITLGSNDLPTDWKDYNFSDLFSQGEASITTEQVLIVLSISGT